MSERFVMGLDPGRVKRVVRSSLGVRAGFLWLGLVVRVVLMVVQLWLRTRGVHTYGDTPVDPEVEAAFKREFPDA